jgi:hypothetical protein
MRIRELLDVLGKAPAELLDATFVGTYQHNPTEIGVLVKMPGSTVNILWNYDPNDDPEWQRLDESQIPPE